MKNKVEQIALDAYQTHTKKYQSLKDKWEELMRRYENEEREGSITEETQSKTRLGQAFSLVEYFVSKVIAQTPRFRYLPREKSDASFTEQYEEFNEYQHDQAMSKDQYEMVAKYGAICGLSGFKMGWRVENILHSKRGKEVLGKTITDPTLVDLMDKVKIGKNVKVNEEETISNWTIDAIAPFDLIWDVRAIDKEDCYVLGHRVHNKTYKDLKRAGYDVKRLSQRIKNDTDYWREQLEKYKGESITRVLERQYIEIAELYVKHQNDQGVYEYWVVTLADLSDTKSGGQPVPIRTEKNAYDKQFCPVGIFRPIKRPGKFYGVGIIEMVEGVIDIEEDTLNMVIEAFWTDVARPMEYNPANVVDEDALEYKPRTLVPVRRLGESIAVMPTPSPNMANASFVLGYLEKTKQNITAITDYQTGSNQLSKEQTATEIQTKTFLSEQRSNKILQRFESEVLEVSGKMALWLNKQYLSDQKEVIYRVLGKKGRMMEKKMKLKVIEAMKDVVIVGGSSAYVDRNQERQRYFSLLQLATNEAAMGPAGIPIDREIIWKQLLEKGYGVKDSENYIPSLKEREEADVKKRLKDIEQAKEENLDPATARVMPDDDPRVHLRLHQAALRNGGTGDIRYTPEQQQMLTEHINQHTLAVGGQNPSFAQATEQAIGQRIQNNINPQQENGSSNNGIPQQQ